MADGVAITAGSGTTVLTDDTGATGHAQVMKLAISTDGSPTLIPADATNGLDVDVTRLPALAAGSATIGSVGLVPSTSGGLSIFRSIDLDETEEDVKTSAGQVYSMWVSNTATSTRFVKFYNATAANVIVGTTTPVMTIAIPGNSSDDVTGFFGSAHGIAFDTAICVAATTGVADADTGAPGANEVLINVFYK